MASLGQTITVSSAENPAEPQMVYIMPAPHPPKFNGSVSRWHHWWSLFKALVHDSTKLSNVHKFMCLCKTLKGEAKRVIGTPIYTPHAYDRAVAKLIKAYTDPDRDRDFFRAKFASLPPPKDNGRDLTRFLRDWHNLEETYQDVVGETLGHDLKDFFFRSKISDSLMEEACIFNRTKRVSLEELFQILDTLAFIHTRKRPYQVVASATPSQRTKQSPSPLSQTSQPQRPHVPSVSKERNPARPPPHVQPYYTPLMAPLAYYAPPTMPPTGATMFSTGVVPAAPVPHVVTPSGPSSGDVLPSSRVDTPAPVSTRSHMSPPSAGVKLPPSRADTPSYSTTCLYPSIPPPGVIPPSSRLGPPSSTPPPGVHTPIAHPRSSGAIPHVTRATKRISISRPPSEISHARKGPWGKLHSKSKSASQVQSNLKHVTNLELPAESSLPFKLPLTLAPDPKHALALLLNPASVPRQHQPSSRPPEQPDCSPLVPLPRQLSLTPSGRMATGGGRHPRLSIRTRG